MVVYKSIWLGKSLTTEGVVSSTISSGVSRDSTVSIGSSTFFSSVLGVSTGLGVAGVVAGAGVAGAGAGVEAAGVEADKLLEPL